MGFYLVNITRLSLTLATEQPRDTLTDAMELLTPKIGIAGLLPGGMHFFNMLVARLEKQRRQQSPFA